MTSHQNVITMITTPTPTLPIFLTTNLTLVSTLTTLASMQMTPTTFIQNRRPKFLDDAVLENGLDPIEFIKNVRTKKKKKNGKRTM